MSADEHVERILAAGLPAPEEPTGPRPVHVGHGFLASQGYSRVRVGHVATTPNVWLDPATLCGKRLAMSTVTSLGTVLGGHKPCPACQARARRHPDREEVTR